MVLLSNGQPRDLVALSWFQLGYRPRESLVLVGLVGPRRRTGPVLRMDLPSALPGRARERRALGRHLLEPLLRAGASAVVALVVTDGPAAAAARFGRGLADLLAVDGLDVADVLLVGACTYRSVLCENPACCPPHGAPLDDVLSSRVAAQMVLQGQVVLDDEADLVADVRPASPAERAGPGRHVPATATGWLASWRAALGGSTAWAGSAEPFARALAGDGRLRDAVMATVAGAPGDGPERLLADGPDAGTDGSDAGTDGSDAGADPGELFGSPPDPDRLERGRALLAEVARTAPEGLRADALAMLAWCAWHSGAAGARARLLVALALQDRPGHRLATIVDQLLRAAVPPPWWRPVDEPEVPNTEMGCPGSGP